MLTQKLTKEALIVMSGVNIQKEASDTMSLFEKTLDGLINGSKELGLPPAEKILKSGHNYKGFKPTG